MSDPTRSNTSGEISISQHEFVGMVTIRADLTDANNVKSIEDATGLKMPVSQRISGSSQNGIAWMSPDEVLVFCATPAKLVDKLNLALTTYKLVVDVSHSRAVFALAGNGSREVLAKGAPVDLSPEAFTVGDFRRTRLGQVAVAFWMESQNPDKFGLVCLSSVQEFMLDWLVNASAKNSLPGYLV